MADQARLLYDTDKTVDLDVLAVHGAAEPDHVSKFPGIVHEMLDGSLAEQIAGGRRNLAIDFQVMTATNRRRVVLWWLDPDRQIICLAATPTISSAELQGGGSLTAEKNYQYKVVAIDVVGGSAASATANNTTDDDYRTIKLTWGSIANARSYKIYRKNNTDAGKHWFLLDYTMDLTYTDDGSVTPLKDLGTDVPPTATSIINVITPNELTFEWMHGTELARMLSLELREASIFTAAEQFPI